MPQTRAGLYVRKEVSKSVCVEFSKERGSDGLIS